MEGGRKLRAFYTTMGALVTLTGAGFVTGVPYQGSDIIALATIIAALGGGFFGANFGEHYAKARAAQNGASK